MQWENTFIDLIGSYIGPTREESLRSHFGIGIPVICLLWETINSVATLPFNLHPVHLLYALYFMKVYTTCIPSASFWKCDVKTFRIWSWRVIFLLYFTLNTVYIGFTLTIRYLSN